MDGSYTGDEIAIVGVAGRFPGAAGVPELWRNLLDGVDCVHDYTEAELRALGLPEQLIADPAHVPSGGRVDGVDGFDAGFFGVPADEAVRMDPQQRLFVEQAWACMEDAGHAPGSYDGVVGVFAGSSVNRYFLYRLLAEGQPDDWEERLAPGWTADYLPAQAAYRLGLTGPAVAVQTACSSSLVAVCQAAQSLLDYRCDLALAGGVSVIEPRFKHVEGGMVAPDGRCRAFDAAAQGAAYGSGVAVLALKRMEDALTDRNHVYGVLRGWAVANDGAARAGFAAPGLEGQAAVVAEALAGAELNPGDIGFVEAHGSGTPVGDAIEVAALARVFRGPLVLGSVKTNLGNLDAAAGAVGLIKAVLAVQTGLIPANLHFKTKNPDLGDVPFVIPQQTVTWEDPIRRAGVSSFGLGGTNAHVIVEQPPEPPERPPLTGRYALPLSARTPEALSRLAAALAAHLAAHPGLRLDDVAHTLWNGRRFFTHRTAVLAEDLPGAVAALATATPGTVAPAPRTGDAPHEPAERWLRGEPVTPPEHPGARRVPLPGYPFERRTYWSEIPR
ncbi:beta-ketoacyl synthase N-terminal-like domain-containing protein [Nonomuraea sp. NPDC050547]|uniref:beta-ketoacyl synthase N-terminal-like domain-containing protein n=1 Tax=Nonomuraea sp. NPDC050547 TaxID=3364368 RepID=UPI00379B044C